MPLFQVSLFLEGGCFVVLSDFVLTHMNHVLWPYLCGSSVLEKRSELQEKVASFALSFSFFKYLLVWVQDRDPLFDFYDLA